MSEKLQYVRMKEYDGRLYRILDAAPDQLMLVVVDGPDLWSARTAKPAEVMPFDASDLKVR